MTDTRPLTLMCVHAHPDDECLSTGGVLARYAATGYHTVLVIATGGEEGEIVVPEMNTPENLARLGSIRDEELAGSVRALGIHVLERLGYRDSGMVGTPANANPDCFHMADKEQATERLTRLIRRHRPDVLVTYDERGGYWHPDHLACHLVTIAAFHAASDPARYPEAGEAWEPRKLYFTARPRDAMLRTWSNLRERGLKTPLDNPDFNIARFTNRDSRVTTVIDVRDYLAQKRAAIACHVTQIRNDGPWFAMPDDVAVEFFGVEHFILDEPRPTAGGGIEDDLFAGLQAGGSQA